MSRRFPSLPRTCAWIAALALAAAPMCVNAENVLVLYDERTDLPGLSAFDSSLAHTFASESDRTIVLYREEMDLSRFDSPDYRLHLRDHLRAKYGHRRIDVVVAVMGPALDFMLHHGDAVAPEAPIVFAGIDSRELNDRALPAHVTGVLLERRFAPTLKLALRLHPDTRRFVFVAGTSDFDRRLIEQARNELRSFEGRYEIRYLTDLPMPALLAELGRLPKNTIVLYSTLFRDGSGTAFVPHVAAQSLAAASNAPVYGFVDQYVGRGIVGGRMYSIAEHGAEAARLSLAVLSGAGGGTPPPHSPSNLQTMLDFRQLERWSIREEQLPSDAVVLNRTPTLWSQHQGQVVAGLSLLAVQAFMIAALLVQRSKSRQAESKLQRLRSELAHMNRIATMGELTASVAHELCQPLGAILCNADAAEMILANTSPSLPEAKEIVEDIQKDAQRAGETIHRIRSMMRKQTAVHRPVELRSMFNELHRLIHAEASARRVVIQTEVTDAAWVLADPVQLQQVLLNLVLNALDAMSACPDGDRRIVLSARDDAADSVRISVSDTGPGLSPDVQSKLFQPFYTTKPEGLGMGLSITRTIVEAHGGSIRAENNEQRGATFRVTLPATQRRSELAAGVEH